MSKYILSIVAIVFIGYFVEILAIDDSFKKYIHTTVGIIIILTLIQPLKNIKDIKVENFFPNSSVKVESQNFSEEITQNNVLILFNNKLENEIETFVKENLGFEIEVKVKTHLNGQNVKIDEISLQNVPEEKLGIIYRTLSTRYGIEKDCIIIE